MSTTREELILKFIETDRDRFVTERATLINEAKVFLKGVEKIPAKILEGKVEPLPSMDVTVLFENLLSDKPTEKEVAAELAVYHKYLREMTKLRNEIFEKVDKIRISREKDNNNNNK